MSFTGIVQGSSSLGDCVSITHHHSAINMHSHDLKAVTTCAVNATSEFDSTYDKKDHIMTIRNEGRGRKMN